MNQDLLKNRAAQISVVVSITVFFLKALAYSLTHSAAILSDALESIVNVVAAIAALYVIRYAAMPADEDHPYGHGKAEYFSSAFEGGLIFFAALMICYEGVKSLIEGSKLNQLEYGLIVVIVASLINLILGLYLKRTGEKNNSEALKASGTHVLSDVWSTLAVLIGLVLVMLTGLTWLDPLMAVVVGIKLCFEGFKIVKSSISALVDEADPEVLDHLIDSFNANHVPGIIDLHHLRIIRAGHFHHVDAHLVVPEFWTIEHVHHVTHQYEENVVKSYRFDGEIAFHLDPCRRAYCTICAISDCPMRGKKFTSIRQFTRTGVTGGPKPSDEEQYGNS